MVVHALIGFLLLVTPALQGSNTLGDEDDNIFVDLGTEHCASEIALVAYEYERASEVTAVGTPIFATYSAFQFESAADALTALDDILELVVETYGDDPESENVGADELATELPLEEDYGDASVAYTMTIPVEDDELDTLFADVLAVVKQDQLALILLFSDTGTPRIPLQTTLDNLVPFADAIDDQWDGYGDLEDALPEPDDMPIGWVGGDVTTGELPPCERDEA